MERRRKQKSDRASQNPDPCITVIDRQKKLPLSSASIQKLVNFFLNQKKISCQYISIYFVSKRKISQIHKKFFNDASPTDCMTFPIGKDFLGECVICPQIALEVNPLNPYEETSHYLIHCLLHLIGYEDIDKKKQAKMRKEEYRLLKLVKKAQCILEA